jgi:hypothetical protein
MLQWVWLKGAVSLWVWLVGVVSEKLKLMQWEPMFTCHLDMESVAGKSKITHSD